MDYDQDKVVFSEQAAAFCHARDKGELGRISRRIRVTIADQRDVQRPIPI